MKYSQSDLILRLEDRIPAYYVSLNGEAKFYTLAGMLLESAGKHADLFGFGYHDMVRDNVYWVLSRFHIKMESYPLMNEPVIIETWPKGPDRLFFMRDYRMSSPEGKTLALATTAWLILDGNKGRPKKIDASHDLQDFHVDDLYAIEQVPDKLPGINEPELQETIRARYSDLDINKHVNALKYIEWVQDFYGQEIYNKANVSEFQINYQLETRFGEEVNVRMNKGPKDETFDYFEGIRITDQKPAFRARIKFDKF